MRNFLVLAILGILQLAMSCGERNSNLGTLNELNQIVEFHIKPNTGIFPWNTRDQMITVKIGDTLRIVNDDNVDHRLHTSGAPCPHGSLIKPGSFGDCIVTRTFDPDQNGPLYDHNHGSNAAFWVRAVAN